ncbi:MAG: biopolymer transporter ExbD [Gemmatimonadaceae bacterium]
MTGETSATNFEPNVTPFLDVLLVLLIIFIAASIQMLPNIQVQLPQPCEAVCASGEEIVLAVGAGPSYAINRSPVDSRELASRITSVYAGRPDKTIQVAGRPGAHYNDVMHAIDVAKSAGVRVVGLVLKR